MNAISMPLSASVTTFRVTSGSDKATEALAASLAHVCHAGDCIKLRGDLGAGKTTFARGFIQALCPAEQEIVSPTFTLVQTYGAHDATIWHLDLYRLRSREEAVEIGLDEALTQGITLIEWPDLIERDLPGESLEVAITIEGPTAQRGITLTGAASAWKQRLASMQQNWSARHG